MSGLYHSTDGAASFTMTYSGTIDGGPGCRVQYTPAPGWLYTVDKKYPGGLPACSMDAGATWSPSSPDPTAGATRRLFADELGGKAILLAGKTALYTSRLPKKPTCDAGSLAFSVAFNATAELFASGAFFEPQGNRVMVGTAQVRFNSSAQCRPTAFAPPMQAHVRSMLKPILVKY
jgi:hypothetical protein